MEPGGHDSQDGARSRRGASWWTGRLLVVGARALTSVLAAVWAMMASSFGLWAHSDPWDDLLRAYAGVAAAVAVWPELRLRPPRYDLRLWLMLAGWFVATVWWVGFRALG